MNREFSNVTQDSYLKLFELFTIDKTLRAHSRLIRLGRASDGGYVLDSRIRKGTYCISLGVSTEVSFDLAISPFVDGIEMYDYSIEGLPVPIPKSNFYRLGVSGHPRKGFVNLTDVFDRVPKEAPLILKMDIEGDEWEVIAGSERNLLDRCDQILVEFHNLQRFPETGNFEELIRRIANVLKNHSVVNVHANNWDAYNIIAGVPVPNVIEVTFLKSDYFLHLESRDLVSETDWNLPNNPSRPDYILYPFK